MSNKNQKSKLKSNKDTRSAKVFPVVRAFVNRNQLLIILTAVALVYLKVFQNDITNRDDDAYILNNPYILSLSISNIIDIFTSYYMGNYHPLSMLLLTSGHAIAGTDPWIYQLINLVLHLLNVLLVYKLVYELCIRRNQQINATLISIVTSALFGLHTLHVESVAWISENKNVLYSFFFLLSLLFYVRFTKSGFKRHYLTSLSFFLLSLLSKGTAVTLPVILVGIDYLLNNHSIKIRQLYNKLPFFFLSLLFGFIAIQAQGESVSIINMSGKFSIIRALCFAGYGLTHYIVKLLLPINLSPAYEYLFNIFGALPTYFYYYLLIIPVTFLVLIYFNKKSPLVFFGLLFFLANIFPVLQLLPVGDSIMADRYTYIPSIGFFLILGIMIEKLTLHFHRFSRFHYFILILYVMLLTTLTYQRIGIWKNSFSVWDDVIKKSGNSIYSRAWLIRGALYNKQGEYKKALSDIEMHLIGHPKESTAYFQSGFAKAGLKDLKGAMVDYKKAASLDSSNAQIYNNMANIQNSLGNYSEAIESFDKAIALNDTFADAYNGRADSRILIRDYIGAEADLNISIRLRPTGAKVYNNRGVVKKQLGNINGALADFNEAIRLEKTFIEAYQNRVDIRISMKDFIAAIADLNYIIEMTDLPYAYYLRGFSYYRLGDNEKTCSDLKQAVSRGYIIADRQLFSLCNLQ